MEFTPDAIVNALITGGAVYAALRVELRWLRADVIRNGKNIDHAHARLDDHVRHYHQRGHDRVDAD